MQNRNLSSKFQKILDEVQISLGNTLEEDFITDEIIDLLKESKKEILLEGFPLNIHSKLLSPSAEGVILLEEDVLDIKSSLYSIQVIENEKFLYHIQKKTKFFSVPLQLKLVYNLAFEILPENLIQWIRKRVLKKFYARRVKDKENPFLEEESKARLTFLRQQKRYIFASYF